MALLTIRNEAVSVVAFLPLDISYALYIHVHNSKLQTIVPYNFRLFFSKLWSWYFRYATSHGSVSNNLKLRDKEVESRLHSGNACCRHSVLSRDWKSNNQRLVPWDVAPCSLIDVRPLSWCTEAPEHLISTNFSCFTDVWSSWQNLNVTYVYLRHRKRDGSVNPITRLNPFCSHTHTRDSILKLGRLLTFNG